MPGPRRIGTLAAAVALAAGVPVLGAAPAHATSYRYWSYWHVAEGGTSWTYSQVGAGGWRVADGTVEGWHFAVSPNTRSAAPPRYDAGSVFAKLCGDESQPAGKARVALVLDYGVAADYPAGDGPPGKPLQGECVIVPERSTGVDVLNDANVTIRDQGGLICALDGHPATGCGEVVADPDPKPTKTAKPTHGPTQKPTHGPSHTAAPTATRTAGSGRTTPARPTTASPARTHSPTPPDTPTTSTTAPGSGTSSASSDPAGGAEPTTPSGPATDLTAPEASPTLAVGFTSSQTADTSSPWPAVVVVLVVAALGGGAYWLRRRSP